MIPDFTNSDLQHRINEVYAPDNPPESALLDAEITLIDAAGAISAIGSTAEEAAVVGQQQGSERKTVEEVWRDIVSGKNERKECKAYQVELESLAMKLEEENEQLLREKLMEKVVPVVEKKRPPRVLRRVRSMQW
uniref:Uncharacterized protein n=1 Tax=Chenopodium quinoa TaxID=63459 RepID=A0A803LHZ7_CHEQI